MLKIRFPRFSQIFTQFFSRFPFLKYEEHIFAPLSIRPCMMI